MTPDRGPSPTGAFLRRAEHDPMLALGDRPALFDADHIADMPAILLVMRREFLRMRNELFVDRMHHSALNPHDDGFVASVTDHHTLKYSFRHYDAFLGRLAAPLAEDGFDPGDVASDLTHPRCVLELPVGALKTQIEDLLTEHVEIARQLVIGLGPDIARLHPTASSPARTTKR